MRINGMNGGSFQAGMAKTDDSVSRNLERQIANAQKQLQQLSSKEDMSLEEKMKKRQEIQKQIYELQNQLRQHEIEVRRESQQAKSNSMEEMLGGKRNLENEKDVAAFSQDGMKAMLSADSAMGQARTQGRVATDLEGKAKVLKGEIQLSRGSNVEAKKGELADLEQKVVNASASQMRSLEEAREDKKEVEKASTEDAGKESGQERTSSGNFEKTDSSIGTETQSMGDSGMPIYKKVDVLL